MDRINGPGATVDNEFTEGDPGLGVPATTVTATWLNGVQEELIHILEEAGLTPSEANLTQVLEALRLLFVRKDEPEATTVRNLLEITAETGSLPANGVFSWGALHVTESTATGPGSADNVMILAANAYWDETGEKWVRRAGGPAVGVRFDPASYSIEFLDGESAAPDTDITWTSRGRFVVAGSGVLTDLDTLDVQYIAPIVSEQDFISNISGVTSTMKARKMPDNTLQIYGQFDKPGTETISAGSFLGYIAGDPFGIGDEKYIFFNGHPTAAPVPCNLVYKAADDKTYFQFYESWDGTPHFISTWAVVPCVGI